MTSGDRRATADVLYSVDGPARIMGRVISAAEGAVTVELASAPVDGVAEPEADTSPALKTYRLDSIRAIEFGEVPPVDALHGHVDFDDVDQPAGQAGIWMLTLRSGEQLQADVVAATSDVWKVRLAGGPSEQPTELTLPVSAMASAWRARRPAGAANTDVEAPKPGEHALIVLDKSTEAPVRVAGVWEGLEDGAARFSFRGAVRSVALDRVAGVVFHAVDGGGFGDRVYVVAELLQGARISGELLSVNADGISLQMSWGRTIVLPRDSVRRLDIRNGRIESLAAMSPDDVEQTPYFGRLIPYAINRALDGGAMRFAAEDDPLAAGVAMHSRSRLHYDTAGRFERFRCRVGFLWPAGQHGQADIRVLGDGTPLFEWTNAAGGDGQRDVDVSIEGVKRLTLEVDFGEGRDVGDHVVFALPELVRAAR